MSTQIVITNAGYAEIINAEKNGTAPVVLSSIALGSGQYTANAGMTAMKSEIKRLEAISGGAAGDNVIHLTAEDSSADVYNAFEVGIFTESGTLFAVYSQNTAIISKSASSIGLLAIDIVLGKMNPESITVGDTQFVINPATTERKGVIEIATETEAKGKTDNERAITAATLQAVIQNHDNIVHRSGAEKISGTKTFTQNPTIKTATPAINIVTENAVKGTLPEVNQNSYIYTYDGNSAVLSAIGTTYDTSGKIQVSIQAYKPESGSNESARLGIAYTKDGSSYTFAPTPAAGDNSTKIATTAWVTAKTKEYLPLAGGMMMGHIFKNTDDKNLLVVGGQQWGNGAGLALYGKNEANYPGDFNLSANNGSAVVTLLGKATGEIKWNSKNIVRSVNNVNADAAGNVTLTAGNVGALPIAGGAMTATKAITREVNNSYISIYGGTGENNDGAHIDLCGANHSTMPSAFQIHARNSTNDRILRGQVDGTLTWDSKTVLTNSTSMPSNASSITLNGGKDYESGSYIRMYGKDHSTYPGWFNLGASDGTNISTLRGLPDGTLTWNGQDIRFASPDMSAGETIANKTEYTAPSNGFIIVSSRAENGESGMTYTINGSSRYIMTSGYDRAEYMIPVLAGDVLKRSGGAMIFYPARYTQKEVAE